MAKIVYGDSEALLRTPLEKPKRRADRIGKLGKITLGCSAAIFDSTKQKVLLTRRSDKGRWTLGHREIVAKHGAIAANAWGQTDLYSLVVTSTSKPTG